MAKTHGYRTAQEVAKGDELVTNSEMLEQVLRNQVIIFACIYEPYTETAVRQRVDETQALFERMESARTGKKHDKSISAKNQSNAG